MSTQIVKCPNMHLVINRLTDYTVRHLSGLANIPHLCIKARHGNGYAWFGVNVLGISDTQPWDQQLRQTIEDNFIAGLEKAIDLKDLESDLHLFMRSLEDIVVGRKRPVMFGGEGNDFIKITSENNVQIEVFRHDVKHESMSYGGYFLTVDNGSYQYPVFVYHRGVKLYNYIDEQEVQDLVIDELTKQFPEVFAVLGTSTQATSLIERNRGYGVLK